MQSMRRCEWRTLSLLKVWVRKVIVIHLTLTFSDKSQTWFSMTDIDLLLMLWNCWHFIIFHIDFIYVNLGAAFSLALSVYFTICFLWVRVMMFNATFNNISDISWRSVLLVEEIGVPGENHRPAASYWQILSHNVVSSTPTPRQCGIQTHNVRNDRHWLHM